MANRLLCENYFAVGTLSDHELFNGRCSIALVDLILTSEIVGKQIHKVSQEMLRNLVSEHIDKLDAGRFKNRQVV